MIAARLVRVVAARLVRVVAARLLRASAGEVGGGEVGGGEVGGGDTRARSASVRIGAALGAMCCTGGNLLHWGQCVALGATPPVQFIAWGQFIAPHGNPLLPVQQIAPVRAGGEGAPRLP